MDGAYRQPTPDLSLHLKDHGHEYAFFQLVEILLRDAEFDVEERALFQQYNADILFRVASKLGFPPSDVVHCQQGQYNDGRLADFHQITVNFMGLHGASSPLPSHMIETAAWSAGAEGIQIAFNDFFSNRLIWLLHLIWRKYRYYVRYKPGAEDQFSNWMFSLIGIGFPQMRKQADIPWARLLTYLGMVAQRVQSPDMVADVVAHAFALQDVELKEFQCAHPQGSTRAPGSGQCAPWA